ncbi:MAG: dihydrofolate reductase family protein [Actinomycetota bacterium]
MIQLFPFAPTTDSGETEPIDDVNAAVAAEPRPDGRPRPWVLTNMIASADGGTAVDGLSGGLGGPGDKAMFRALRAVADVILVGAATVREEGYRPPTQPPAIRERREADGRDADPRVVVVTGSLGLDPDLELFADPTNRPMVATVSGAPADRRAALEPVAEVVDVDDGAGGVDLGRLLELLGERGVRTVLAEGGPSLNGQLIADGLIDEWNLTLSPHLLGGPSRRAAVGPVDGGPPPAMRLQRIWTDDDYLFCRWVRQGPANA